MLHYKGGTRPQEFNFSGICNDKYSVKSIEKLKNSCSCSISCASWQELQAAAAGMTLGPPRTGNGSLRVLDFTATGAAQPQSWVKSPESSEWLCSVYTMSKFSYSSVSQIWALPARA